MNRTLECIICHQSAKELSEEGICLHCCESVSSVYDGPEEFDPLDPIGEEGRHVD